MHGLVSAESTQNNGPFFSLSNFPTSNNFSTPTPCIELFSSLYIHPHTLWSEGGREGGIEGGRKKEKVKKGSSDDGIIDLAINTA